MDFGKVKDTRNIDFTLPPDDPATAIRLAKSRGEGEATLRVYVGCPVWQDDAMARKLCPPRTPKAKRLAGYARQFNSLELNSTGYGLTVERVRKWASETSEDFRFCPKVTRDITLGPNLDGVWRLFAEQCEAVEAFGNRLGPLFLQFPESFSPARFAELERLLTTQAGRLPLAVEVRHEAWFRNPQLKDRLFTWMEAHGIASIITDTPGRRDVLHQRLTTSTAFIRFNGHALGPQDYGRLDAWARRVKAWMDMGLRELYLFPHVDPVDQTIELAAHFIKSLNQATGLNLKPPRLQEENEEPSLAL